MSNFWVSRLGALVGLLLVASTRCSSTAGSEDFSLPQAMEAKTNLSHLLIDFRMLSTALRAVASELTDQQVHRVWSILDDLHPIPRGAHLAEEKMTDTSETHIPNELHTEDGISSEKASQADDGSTGERQDSSASRNASVPAEDELSDAQGGGTTAALASTLRHVVVWTGTVVVIIALVSTSYSARHMPGAVAFMVATNMGLFLGLGHWVYGNESWFLAGGFHAIAASTCGLFIYCMLRIVNIAPTSWTDTMRGLWADVGALPDAAGRADVALLLTELATVVVAETIARIYPSSAVYIAIVAWVGVLLFLQKFPRFLALTFCRTTHRRETWSAAMDMLFCALLASYVLGIATLPDLLVLRVAKPPHASLVAAVGISVAFVHAGTRMHAAFHRRPCATLVTISVQFAAQTMLLGLLTGSAHILLPPALVLVTIALSATLYPFLTNNSRMTDFGPVLGSVAALISGLVLLRKGGSSPSVLRHMDPPPSSRLLACLRVDAADMDLGEILAFTVLLLVSAAAYTVLKIIGSSPRDTFYLVSRYGRSVAFVTFWLCLAVLRAWWAPWICTLLDFPASLLGPASSVACCTSDAILLSFAMTGIVHKFSRNARKKLDDVSGVHLSLTKAGTILSIYLVFYYFLKAGDLRWLVEQGKEGEALYWFAIGLSFSCIRQCSEGWQRMDEDQKVRATLTGAFIVSAVLSPAIRVLLVAAVVLSPVLVYDLGPVLARHRRLPFYRFMASLYITVPLLSRIPSLATSFDPLLAKSVHSVGLMVLPLFNLTHPCLALLLGLTAQCWSLWQVDLVDETALAFLAVITLAFASKSAFLSRSMLPIQAVIMFVGAIGAQVASCLSWLRPHVNSAAPEYSSLAYLLFSVSSILGLIMVHAVAWPATIESLVRAKERERSETNDNASLQLLVENQRRITVICVASALLAGGISCAALSTLPVGDSFLPMAMRIFFHVYVAASILFLYGFGSRFGRFLASLLAMGLLTGPFSFFDFQQSYPFILCCSCGTAAMQVALTRQANGDTTTAPPLHHRIIWPWLFATGLIVADRWIGNEQGALFSAAIASLGAHRFVELAMELEVVARTRAYWQRPSVGRGATPPVTRSDPVANVNANTNANSPRSVPDATNANADANVNGDRDEDSTETSRETEREGEGRGEEEGRGEDEGRQTTTPLLHVFTTSSHTEYLYSVLIFLLQLGVFQHPLSPPSAIIRFLWLLAHGLMASQWRLNTPPSFLLLLLGGLTGLALLLGDLTLLGIALIIVTENRLNLSTSPSLPFPLMVSLSLIPLLCESVVPFSLGLPLAFLVQLLINEVAGSHHLSFGAKLRGVFLPAALACGIAAVARIALPLLPLSLASRLWQSLPAWLTPLSTLINAASVQATLSNHLHDYVSLHSGLLLLYLGLLLPFTAVVLHPLGLYWSMSYFTSPVVAMLLFSLSSLLVKAVPPPLSAGRLLLLLSLCYNQEDLQSSASIMLWLVFFTMVADGARQPSTLRFYNLRVGYTLLLLQPYISSSHLSYWPYLAGMAYLFQGRRAFRSLLNSIGRSDAATIGFLTSQHGRLLNRLYDSLSLFLCVLICAVHDLRFPLVLAASRFLIDLVPFVFRLSTQQGSAVTVALVGLLLILFGAMPSLWDLSFLAGALRRLGLTLASTILGTFGISSDSKI